MKKPVKIIKIRKLSLNDAITGGRRSGKDRRKKHQSLSTGLDSRPWFKGDGNKRDIDRLPGPDKRKQFPRGRRLSNFKFGRYLLDSVSYIPSPKNRRSALWLPGKTSAKMRKNPELKDKEKKRKTDKT